MEDTIMNSVVPAAICELETDSTVKDEPKVDAEADIEVDPDVGGGCFDVLDMVEETFDEGPTNYFSSDDEEADKSSSHCDSSSDSGSPSQRQEASAANISADSHSVETDGDEDMEEVFETIDGDPSDYEECYVAERPPSPPENPIPRGWKQVYHESGATIFVHLETNVCSLSRPYYLGSNSTKFHKLPTTPVPCLRYRSYREKMNENVTEYAAAIGSSTSTAGGEAVSDTTTSTCPVSSSTVISETSEAISTPNADISNSSSTISNANVVTCSGDSISSVENPSYSDMKSCTPAYLAMYTKNVLNTANALASDADSIQFHMNVATSTSVTTVPTSALISDTNPSMCPVRESSNVESAVTSGTDAPILSQNLDTSDVIMIDVSAATLNPQTAEAPVSDTNISDVATSAIIFDSNAVLLDPNAVMSTTIVTASTTTVETPSISECDTSTSAAESATSFLSVPDAIPSASIALATSPQFSDGMSSASMAFATSSQVPDGFSSASMALATSPQIPDAIPSTSSALATSSQSNVPASSSNASAPSDEGTGASPMDTEPASTCNDTIAVDTATGEEAQLLEYCKRLFKFKKIKYLKFRSWDVRRTYLRALRNERNRRRCPFSNNKFVSFPIETKDSEGNVVATKKWIINPRGRSYVAILHEYLQQSKKTQPEYKFTEVDNARNPYAATVVVNGTEYGTGFGMSKKEAKFEAAKATLEVLLPKMMKYVLSVCCDKTGNKKYDDCSDNEDDHQNVASAFDDIEITDPRVTELSLQTTEPKPYELLVNCLQKKGDQPEVKFEFQAESMESTMAVGENQVTVKCGNKREGKQLAAQAMLQQLHPHIKNWGSLLRLYGNCITNQYRQVIDDKDMEELKSKPANNELLDTLRRRMSSLADTDHEGAQVSTEKP